MPREDAIARGEYYLKYSRWQDAAATVEPIVKENPGDWQAQIVYGRAELELGDLNAARDALERALAGNPNDTATIFALADALYRLQDTSALYQRLRGAGADLHSIPAYLLLAQYAEQLNDPDTAFWAVNAAIEVDDGIESPRSATPYVRAANLAAKFGKVELENRRLRQAYGINPLDLAVVERLESTGAIVGPSFALPPGV